MAIVLLMAAGLAPVAAWASSVEPRIQGSWVIWYPPAEADEHRPFQIEQRVGKGRLAIVRPIALRFGTGGAEVELVVRGCTERFDGRGFDPIRVDLRAIPETERRAAYLEALNFLVRLGKRACPAQASDMRFDLDRPEVFLALFERPVEIPNYLKLRLGQ